MFENLGFYLGLNLGLIFLNFINPMLNSQCFVCIKIFNYIWRTFDYLISFDSLAVIVSLLLILLTVGYHGWPMNGWNGCWSLQYLRISGLSQRVWEKHKNALIFCHPTPQFLCLDNRVWLFARTISILYIGFSDEPTLVRCSVLELNPSAREWHNSYYTCIISDEKCRVKEIS